jgi:5-methylcytosine-specific restriction endonuclease McrA
MIDHLHDPVCTKKAGCNCAKHCVAYACLFARRSASIYRGLQSRMAAKKWQSGARKGEIRREKITIPYTLDEFRAWLRVTLEDQPVCEYCTVSINIMNISPDHAKPLKRGGTLERRNLRGVCDICNRTKGELLPGEYRALMAGLATFTEAGRNDVLKRLRGAHLHFGGSRDEKKLEAKNVLAIPAKKEEPF